MTPRALSLFVVAGLALGCAKADTITVKPEAPEPPELVPSPLLETQAYKKILLLPFEGTVQHEGIESNAIKGQTADYYTSKVEKGLLSQGFQVISPEIVAGANKSAGGGGSSAAERAMQMGRETKAHAVFIIQTISVQPEVDFFLVDELDTQRVDAAKVDQNLKNGQFFDKESEDCVFRLPYYAVRMEAKLIDVQSGQVLWVGSGRHTAITALAESYVAKLDKECKAVDENFVFTDKVGGEGHFALTVGGLITSLLDPLKTGAFKGKKIALDKPKAQPKKLAKVGKPKALTAVVSTKKASVRAGPGKKNERLRYISRKTKVTVTETMGEWSKVELQDGTVGWMHESTIIVND